MFRSDSDAQKAMTKDRQNMQHRYVELFYNGSGGGGGNSGGGGNGQDAGGGDGDGGQQRGTSV